MNLYLIQKGLCFLDQQLTHRVQPSGTSQKPAKRSHVSPLHQDGSSGGMESKLVKPVATAGFSFGTAKTVISSEASLFTQSTSDAVSSFSTVPGFGSAFPTFTGMFSIQCTVHVLVAIV